MQKIKFKINGLKCASCALLIEEKLKNKKGIIKIKVDPESCKGVAVCDEQKISETEIFQEIEKIDDFKIEKIEELPEIRKDDSKQKIQPFLKTLIAVNVLFLILNLVLLNSSLGQKNPQNAQVNSLSPQQKNQQPDPADLQAFSITKDNHIRGDFNAPITLVEFSDFECPFCERHYPTLNKILSDYEGKVRLVYKHFPLGFHKNAQKAAESSECASEQGKFWEYHDKLFENFQLGYSEENFKKWAKDLGLNNGKFNECFDSGKFAQKVKDDQQEGVKKGVNGTPATFINGQLVSGALPYDSFKQIIDNLLQ
ncbi:MAG: putative lipoprotein [Parcubacteria group bacterium Licking1014_1]|nr:MAG: putative lipoprotein [Parcubacteria group bacterium Licking1014_1]